MSRYNPKEIEPKWQAKWLESKLYEVSEDSPKTKIYATPMLPYPSGAGLHTGHVRNYSISDAVARFYRQKGFNTMSNIGWDAFGLPAENYAIKTGTPPAESTAKNIAYFKEQVQRLGMSFAWDREINTSDPSYYKWTQWVFTQLFDKGLAYQAESLQWWCPSCKTVLANEQVINGKCWRHEGPDDPPVIKKSTKQWFFKITNYADELLAMTDDLDWPEKIRTMQKNWIGRSTGAEIDFQVVETDKTIKVFTTRPDTLYGATFMVLAPEHELVSQITSKEQLSHVQKYVREAEKKTEIERLNVKRDKTGVFTGAYAVNPANNEKIPIWVADYVLAGYGTGAIMAVPGHDQRDADFARQFKLPIRFVVEPVSGTEQGDEHHKQASFIILRNPKTNEVVVLDWGPRQARSRGKMLIGGGVEADETFREAAEREIREETGYDRFKFVREAEFGGHGYFYSDPKQKNMYVYGHGLLYDLVDETMVDTQLDDGEKNEFQVTWEPAENVATMLDDGVHEAFYRYLILHEMYEGEGRMINSGPYNGQDSAIVRDKIVADLAKKGVATEKVNYKIRDWLISRQRYWGAPIPIIHCPTDGPVAVPAKDLPVVLPYVKDYAPTGKTISVLASVEDWVNVPCPKCGQPAKRETDTMDGYACSSWYMYRYTDAHNDQAAWDPAKVNYWLPVDFYFGGDHAISHLLYFRFWHKFFCDQGLIDGQKVGREPVKRLVFNGYINAEDGRKMSKSLGNTIDPMDIINSGYGADALRVFELFIAPYDQDTSWNTNGVPGAMRFLQRVWTLVQDFLAAKTGDLDEPSQKSILQTSHQTIKKVTDDMEHLTFNTAVSSMMEMTNKLYVVKGQHPVVQTDAWRFALESLLQLLAPFAPHMSEELWHQLDYEDSIHIDHWPLWDDQYLVMDTMKIAVQVNGKLRGEIEVAADADQSDIMAAAKALDRVKTYTDGHQIVKEIYVPGRLVSLVVK